MFGSATWTAAAIREIGATGWLMPRFSLKQTLIAVAAFSLLAMLLASASRGNMIASGFLVGVAVFAVAVPLAMALVYQLATLLMRLTGGSSEPSPESQDASS